MRLGRLGGVPLLATLLIVGQTAAHAEGVTTKYLTFEGGHDRSLPGWTYNAAVDHPDGDAGFTENGTRRLLKWYAWDWNEGPDFGFPEIDNTRGALGTTTSLKYTITGGHDTTSSDPAQRNGCMITSKEEYLAKPQCVGTGLGGSLYTYFMNGGYQVTQAVGANRFSLYMYLPRGWAHIRDFYGNYRSYDFHLTQNHCDPAQNPCTSPRGSISEGEPTTGRSGHFYHYLKIAKGGGWVHVLLDQHPQHERQDKWDFKNNPTARIADFGFKNYYDTLVTFYIDGTGPQLVTPFNIWVDEMEFYHTSTTTEPNQNDDTIASVTVGYFPEGDGMWGLGFQGYDGGFATWEVRYSTSPITNANFPAATPITALTNGVPGRPGRVRKLTYDGGYPAVWVDFDLPAALKTPGQIVFFAIKDVSQLGQHATATMDADTRTATNSNIHTIDFHVPGSSPAGPPATPSGLVVR